MELLNREILARLPRLYATENEADPWVQAKFFTPDAQATWFALEFDGEDLFFGLADLGFDSPELGYFSLAELKSIRGHLGLPVELDQHFSPVPLSVARSGNAW